MMFVTKYVNAFGEAYTLVSEGWLRYHYNMMVLRYTKCKNIRTAPAFTDSAKGY